MVQGIVIPAVKYWATVFLIGFLLGTLRVLFVAPRLGETRAVLLEMPFMLAASWAVSRRIVGRNGTAQWRDGLAIGALAFTLLLASELVLAVTVFGRSPGQWFAALFNTSGLLGLAGQLVFAAMPAIVLSCRTEE